MTVKKLARAFAFAAALFAFGSSAQAACYNWSTTAATNGSADPTINWAEGMAPSSVNDSARAMMARMAECRLDESGSLQTAGTSTAYTLATNQVFDTLAHMDGRKVCFRVHATNGTPVQLNVDGLGLKPLRSSPSVEVPANSMILGSPYCAVYNNSDAAFYLQDYYPLTIGANTITTAMLQNSAVTYAKIQNETNNTILGNISGGSAAPQEITLGAGLLGSGGTLRAPAFPPAGAYRNLAVKVLTNTTVSVTADFVTVTDGTNYQTLAFNCSGGNAINYGTNGGVNALDAGTIAIDTWYFVWAIAKADGTTACLASTSATAPTMPTGAGYTYKARVGATKTAHASAIILGTWQYGSHAQFVVGLAGLGNLLQIASGGGIGSGCGGTTPTYQSFTVNGGNVQASYVPSTASKISIVVGAVGGNLLVAPNSSYNGRVVGSATFAPFGVASSNAASYSGSMLLESSSIFVCSDTASNAVAAWGWEDNL